MTTTYTSHFKIPKADFNTRPWHQIMEAAFDRIDTVIWQNVFSANIVLWDNEIEIFAGQTAIDGETGQFWTALVNHTTSAAPQTFEEDRTDFPLYWAQSSTVPEYRGAWITAHDYINTDFVSEGGVFYVCKVAHTSGVFEDDLADGYWNVVIDPVALTDAVDAAEAAVVDAEAQVNIASQWASQTSGIVVTVDYSAKAWAIGGTDVTNTAARGAAKEWAAKTGGTVDTAEYSAKEWSIGTTIRGVSGKGSAKDWAIYEGGTVDDTGYSAKYWAGIAAASAGGATTFIGIWDASAGTFPGGGTTNKGAYYLVTVAGTVDGVAFSIGDQIFAIVNNASTGTYANNWVKVEGAITTGEIVAALGYTPVTDARTVSAGGIATGGGALTANQTITVTKATGAEVTTGTDDTHAVTPKALADAGVNIPATTPAGRIRLGYFTAADTGWVLLNDGTFGNTGSGATYADTALYAAVYAAIWNSTANAECAVSTGRGADAAADFAAGKTIAQPKVQGRTLGVFGSGSGLTARVMAKIVGEETHTPTLAEMYAHGGHVNSSYPMALGENSNATGSGSLGSSTPFNVMSPTVFLNAEIKL